MTNQFQMNEKQQAEWDLLMRRCAISHRHYKIITEELQKNPDSTILEIIDRLGIRNATHIPLDLDERLKTALDGYRFDVGCYLVGLSGYRETILRVAMTSLNGMVSHTEILEEIRRFASGDPQWYAGTHPAEHILLKFIPKEMYDHVLEEVAKNDAAHQRDHVLGVVALAETIIQAHEDTLGPWRNAVLLGAFLHDVSHHEGRVNHHNAGADKAKIILAKYMQGSLSPAELRLIDSSIRTHRSSFKEKRDHIVQDAVAAADLGVPDWKRYVRRAAVYQIDRLFKDKTEHEKNVIRDRLVHGFTDQYEGMVGAEVADHMVMKYSHEGYAWKSVSPYTLSTWPKQVQETKDALSDKILISAYMEEIGLREAIKSYFNLLVLPLYKEVTIKV